MHRFVVEKGNSLCGKSHLGLSLLTYYFIREDVTKMLYGFIPEK
jgi:hypothetical protein